MVIIDINKPRHRRRSVASYQDGCQVHPSCQPSLMLVYTIYGGSGGYSYIAVEYTNLICLLRLHCTYPFSLWPWLTYSRISVYSGWLGLDTPLASIQ